MTNQISKFAKFVVLGALVAAAAFAQGSRPNYPVSAPLSAQTTITAAVSLGGNQQVCLTSATGVSTPSLASGLAGSFIFVDNESMQVTQSVTSLCYRVKRGQLGTQAQAHSTGAVAWVGNATNSTGDTSRPSVTGLFDMGPANPLSLSLPLTPPGTTDVTTAMVAGTIYWSQIEVKQNRPVLGACVLNGGTVATDLHIFALYDFAGNLLAQTASTVAAGVSILQCLPFVTPIEISGDRVYYIAVQSNGTTQALIARYVTGQMPLGFQAGSVTGTYATIPATLAIPATFTSIKGPLAALY